MAAYHKVEVSLNTNAVEVGIPSPQSVTVTVPTVGPVGPQGPAGPKGDPGEVSGSIAWDNVTDKPSTFTPSSHTHVAADVTDFAAAVAAVSPPVDWNSLTGKPATFAPSFHTHSGDEVYLGEGGDPQPVRLTGFADSGINGIYWPQDIAINSKPVYKKNRSYGLFYENDTWHVFDTVPISANILESSDNDSADFPQQAAAWNGVVGLANVANFSKDAAQQFVFVGDNIPSTQVTGLSIPAASTATPSALGVAAAGSSNDFARADHVHAMPSPNDISSTLGEDNLAADLNYLDAAVGAIPAPSSATPQPLGTAAAGTSTEHSRADHVHAMPSAADVGAAASTHAAAHASAGSDPLFDQDLNTTDAVTFESVTATDLFGLSAFEVVGVSPNRIDINGENGIIFFGTTAASTRTNLGLGTAAVADIGNGAGDVAEGDHGHGNITSDGKIGSTAGLPVVTTTAGAVTTLALGTAGQVLTVNGTADGVEFAAASGGGASLMQSIAVGFVLS